MQRLYRLDEIYHENPAYFITACNFGRKRILADVAVHEAFREFCLRAKDHGVLVGRYVLMPDHLHLFVCVLPGEMTLSGWMKSLKNSLSKDWRGGGIAAPHWQKGFFDHLLRSHETVAEKWLYVRENPVRAGLSESPEEWPFAGEILPFTQGQRRSITREVAAVYDRRKLAATSRILVDTNREPHDAADVAEVRRSQTAATLADTNRESHDAADVAEVRRSQTAATLADTDREPHDAADAAEVRRS
jgi:putative transposase